MTQFIEDMFAEMIMALGYNEWYETEELWDDIAEIMVQAGADEDAVYEFFAEMTWDL